MKRPSLAQALSPRAKLFKNYPLHKILYYRIGGPAEALLMNPSNEDLEVALRWVCDEGIAFHILGSGTNLLVSDQGLPGLSIFLGPSGPVEPTVLSEDARQFRIRIGAEQSKADLLDWAMQRKVLGLEFSAGIPGTLGGAVFMNAGTKWGSYKDVIEGVHLFSILEGRLYKTSAEMGFRYRGHGEALKDGVVIESVDFCLPKAQGAGELEKSRKLVDEILTYRGVRQPLDYPSCGSVFKNPENSERGAGRLIEASGLKGLRRGRAMISLKHANFILNLGGAKAADVNGLIKTVVAKVQADHGILLEPEVIRLGEFQ